MKAGENIRINLRIQEASSGKILTAEKVEGVGNESLFPMVDDLTRRVMARLDVSPVQSTPHRSLQEVTTSSVEAFRFYSQGLKLHYEFKEEEAIPLFEKAIEVDPDFAMALARLATIHLNLGHDKEAFDLGSRAVARAERLPRQERSYIEGNFYMRREETYAKALQIYERSLAEDEKQWDLRNNVAMLDQYLELYPDAIAHLERVRGITDFAPSYGMLSGVYARQGRFDEGEKVVRELLALQPDSSTAYRFFARLQFQAGRLEDARKAIERERILDPASPWPDVGLSYVGLLEEDWNESRTAASNLTRARNPYFQWWGHFQLATDALYHAEAADALASLDASGRAFPEPEVNTGSSESTAAHILIELGRYPDALERAERARRYGAGNWPEWEGLYYQSLAQQFLGRARDADESLRALERRTASIPGPKEKRRVLQLTGELALARRETAQAIETLTEAESMLPLRGFPGFNNPVPHLPIWYSLAKAHLDTGNEDEALRWFGRIAESAHEHIEWPILYVRSLYFLGTIHESRGEAEKAQTYFRRFVDLWGEGEIDRDRVQEARKKL